MYNIYKTPISQATKNCLFNSIKLSLNQPPFGGLPWDWRLLASTSAEVSIYPVKERRQAMPGKARIDKLKSDPKRYQEYLAQKDRWNKVNQARYYPGARRRRRANRIFIDQFKAGKACACGTSDPVLLDFHHTDPSRKLLDIGRLGAGTSRERVLEEMSKCVLMCANCHRIHTWELQDRSGTSRSAIRLMEKKTTLNGIKADKGCRSCGIRDFRCLEFHHIDPSTKVLKIGIAASGKMSMDRILAEVAKCEVLCVNCHRLEHVQPALFDPPATYAMGVTQ